jgi:hypothetical protein
MSDLDRKQLGNPLRSISAQLCGTMEADDYRNEMFVQQTHPMPWTT